MICAGPHIRAKHYSPFTFTPAKTDDESCVLLAQVLKVGSPELTTLDLRGNVLDVEGDNALAIVLRDMTSLT